jgi:NAD-dependent SIR2 family protein deacetylase
MMWAGKSRRTVFVLGAGATRGAVPHVLVNRKRIKAPLNRDFFKVVEKFATAHGDDQRTRNRYLRLRKALENEFPTRGKWPLPMEEAFSLLYVSKDFPEIYSTGAGRRRQPGSRKEIEDFLRLTFAVLGAIELGAKPQNLYSKLVHHLEPSDTIITLNYDTVLDRALIRSGWSPDTGYCLIGGRNKVIPRSSGIPASPRLASVKLLKLHGSLNWMVRGSYKKVQRVFEKKPSQVLVHKFPRKNEKSGFIRQIIPPIYGKFFNHPHWQTLWGHAYKAIIESDVVVVIGCSLVDTDFHLSGMLGHAIRERKRSAHRFEYAILVDKSVVRRKWQRLLKGNVAAKAPYRTFAKFMKVLERTRGKDE